MSLVGSAPVIMVPSFNHVIAFAPHPDDETIGCGGTLALLAAGGTDVHVVIATDGEAGLEVGVSPVELGAKRKAEAREACALLGVRPPRFLGQGDGSLWEELPGLTSEVAQIIAEIQPEAVFVPWPLDGHPDHQALSAALGQALLSQSIEVWGYEVWAALPCNRLVDISNQWDVKQAALAAHKSARATYDTSAHLALSRWRSLHGLAGRGHAEAFLVLDGPSFSEMAEQAKSP